MAGGTWMSQNKVQPGVYINTKSSGNLSASVGEKGVVAIAEPLSWGPCEVIQTIIPGEDLTPYIGYDVTSEKAMFLREMMNSESDQDPSVSSKGNRRSQGNRNDRNIDGDSIVRGNPR